MPSDTTVYIQGGAVVKAQIRTNPFWNGGGGTTMVKTNITIRGRGVIDCSEWCGNFTDAAKYHEPEMPGIVLFTASDVTVQGIVVLNPPRQQVIMAFGANNDVIDNVKGFTCFTGGDGIDCSPGCSNIVVQNCFVRSGDDVFACDGGTADITYQNNVTCSMRGHGWAIYGGGDLNNYTAKNCYGIYEYGVPDAEGAIGLYAGLGVEQNISFENIHIERAEFGSMLEAYPYSFFDGLGGGSISNVLFENITYNSNSGYSYAPNPVYVWSNLGGASDAETISSVYFNNCYFNGNLVTNSASGAISIGSYASNVEFNNVVPGGNPDSYALTTSPA